MRGTTRGREREGEGKGEGEHPSKGCQRSTKERESE